MMHQRYTGLNPEAWGQAVVRLMRAMAKVIPELMGNKNS